MILGLKKYSTRIEELSYEVCIPVGSVHRVGARVYTSCPNRPRGSCRGVRGSVMLIVLAGVRTLLGTVERKGSIEIKNINVTYDARGVWGRGLGERQC